MATCSECEFYEALNGVGLCKVHAPEQPKSDKVKLAEWPKVLPDRESCGDFASA